MGEKEEKFAHQIHQMPQWWFKTRYPVQFSEAEKNRFELNIVPKVEPEYTTRLLNTWIGAQHVSSPVDNGFSLNQLQSLRLGMPTFQPMVSLIEKLATDLAGLRYPYKTILQKREDGQVLTAGGHQDRTPSPASFFWILFLNRCKGGGNYILPDFGKFGGPEPGWVMRMPARCRLVITPPTYWDDPLFTLEGWVTDHGSLQENVYGRFKEIQDQVM